jgi:hypothetical protein
MYNVCDVCGVVDEEPKHGFVVLPDTFPVNEAHILTLLERTDLTAEQKAEALADIQDTEIQRRHFACCVTEGCPSIGSDGDCALRAGG